MFKHTTICGSGKRYAPQIKNGSLYFGPDLKIAHIKGFLQTICTHTMSNA